MSRQIKFRGKRYDNQEWIIGGIYVFESTNRYFIVDLAWFTPTHPKQNWQVKGIEVIPETVGQFTGLLDANGNEIYEGDIIQWQDERGDGSIETFSATVEFEGGAYQELSSMPSNEFTVIGNIHQTNPV